MIWGISLGIIVLQRDLGTGLLIFGMFIAMLYVATGKTSWVLIGVVLAVAGGFLASQVLPYVQSRFTNWLDPFNPDHRSTAPASNSCRASSGSRREA